MTELTISRDNRAKEEQDALVLLVTRGLAFTPSGERFDTILKNQLARFIKSEFFLVKRGNVLLYYTHRRNFPRIILAAIPMEEPRLTELREAAYASVRMARQHGLRRLALAFDPQSEEEVQAIGEGALLGTYRYQRFKSEKDPKPAVTEVRIISEKGSKEGIRRASVFAEANMFVRDLVNEPPNILNPVRLAEIAVEVARDSDLRIKVFDPESLRKLGAEAFLSVGKGSKMQGRMIHLTYTPEGRSRFHVALVGKGITFDSGGLSLKTEKGMEHMKSDMAGAANVLACVRGAKQLKLPIKVTGLMMVTENMPNGGANRPGDVVRAMNGKTIEITNTDAEGRLALADGLTYAERLSPDYIVDIATLTGAQVIGLGCLVGAVMGNDPTLIQRIVQAGEKSGESMWPLPLPKPYQSLIKSDIADIKNSSGIPEAGSIQGGLFLSEFVSKSKWAHLDIAGPSWQEREWSVYARHASGFGARCLLTFLAEIS